MTTVVHYEYRAEDRSLLLRWLREPVLMPIVRALPHRVTPNQVTMAGHACLWVTAAAALARPAAGAAILLALAFGYTAFNLADTIDGMYARHSGRSSRLGELLDHGLDPVSFGLVLLTYGVVMREPAWLVLASTAAVAFTQYATFLHGYRVGVVVLGELGIIEALAAATLFCLAAALGGYEWLTAPRVLGLSVAGAFGVGCLLGSVVSLADMRRLAAHAADALPLVVLTAIDLVWYAYGDLSVTMGGLLVVFTTASQAMAVTSARLRRVPLAPWDVPLLAITGTAAAVSIWLGLSPSLQAGMAAAVTLYPLVRGGDLFQRTARAI